MDTNDTDWTAIRAEYVTTDIGLKKLSEKYGVPLATIKRRSSKEGWVEERKNRKEKAVDQVIQTVVQNDAKNIAKKLAGLQTSAENLAALIQVEIGDAWAVREAKRKAGALITDEDTKILKDLTTAMKGVVDVIRDVYAIPSIKEQIDLEKWEREKQIGSGATEGGIIFLPPVLPPVMEGGGDDGEDDMDTTAEAD